MKTVLIQNNIPAGWSLVSLRSLTSKIGSGVTPRGGSHVYQSSGIRFLRSQNIQNGRLSLDDVAYISPEIDSEMTSSRVLPGDILYNITGASIGRSALYNLNEPANVNQHVCVIRLKKDSPKFVGYFLLSHLGEKELFSFQAGGNREGLNYQQLGSFKLSLPPLPEQKRIVAVLEAWDLYLEKLAKKIELKKRIKKSLMQQLLTGKRRLEGFVEPWDTKPLSQLASIQKGEQLSSDNHSVSGKYPHLNGGIQPSGYTDKSNAQANTIAISEGGNSCGHVQFVTEEYWCGGHCYSVTPMSGINNKFLYYLLKETQRRIMALRVGSGLPNVQKSTLKNLKLKYPVSIKEQAAIADVLTKADDVIGYLERKKHVIDTRKKYLLNSLITGAIRTPEDLLEKVAPKGS